MNVNKTQAMFILPRGSNRATTIDINITCGSRFLEIVSYYKYLGVILDENLTWEHHILHITKKIGALARASQQLMSLRHVTSANHISTCSAHSYLFLYST